MATEKYQGIIKAAMKGESALWEVGDELIKEIGMPSSHGVRDESYKKLAPIAEELETRGIGQYSISYLSKLRLTANNFPESTRVKSVAWRVHYESGSPETLKNAMAYAREVGEDLSYRFVISYKKTLKDEDRKARKEAHKDALAAKKEAEAEAVKAREDKRAANSREAKETAAKREQDARERAKEAALLARDLKIPPAINHAAPKKGPADVPMLVVRTTFNADVEKAKALAEKMDRNIEAHLDSLSDTFVANAVDELLEVANAFRQLSNKIRSGRSNKRSHLYAVGE